MNHIRNIMVMIIFLFFMYFPSLIKCENIKIEIINFISNQIEITCTDKHRNGVVGSTRIEINESFEIECRKKLMRDAECKCEVKMGNQVEYFHPYISSRDENICGKNCRWYLIFTGPWLADINSARDNPTYVRKYEWGDHLINEF